MKELIMLNQKAIIILLLFIVIDVITGLIKAVINKEVNSTKMREGLLKKLLEVLVVIVAFGCDYLLELDYIGNIVLVAFCGMEGISVLENAGEFIPLPTMLKNVLANLRDKGEEAD